MAGVYFFDYDDLDEALERRRQEQEEKAANEAQVEENRPTVDSSEESFEEPFGSVLHTTSDRRETPLTSETFDSNGNLLEDPESDNTRNVIAENGFLYFGEVQPSQVELSFEENSDSESTVASADDGLSEIWPGDTSYLGDLGEEQDSGDTTDVSQDDKEHVFAWEVVFSRIVVRSAPSWDAAPLGFASRRELFFAEPEEANDENWVKLSKERGYILKDGRKRDPKLSLLIQPFSIDLLVPAQNRQEVLRLMRDNWAKARTASKNYLKPLLIDKLRNCCEDALNKANTYAFDMGVFKDELLSKMDEILEPLLENGTNGSGILHAQVNGDGGPKPWSHETQQALRREGQVTAAYALKLLENMKVHRRLPCAEDAVVIVTKATSLFGVEPSLVELTVPYGSKLHVVGDLHGQFWDLLHILDTHGSPSKDNWYLFNGDFVDRGQFSVEVVLALFALKAAFPNSVHLNRGNHEAARMNAHYGFMTEAKLKYNAEIFVRFVMAFKTLPLAHVVNKSVFVVHGGLPRQDGVRLEDIKQLDRKREPDDSAQDLMIDLLWSDPMEGHGRGRSPRGAGTLFGPDVTEQFCRENGLICVIRSHEMKDDGHEWIHDEMCLTIFSAANYCDMCGNFGAVCDIVPRRHGATSLAKADISVQKFEASPHPCERTGQLQSVFQLFGK